MQSAYRLTAGDRVLQKTPFSFDVSVWEFFWPLITGAQLVMAPPGAHQDPVHLSGLIRRHEITTLHFVPSMLQIFLEQKGLSEACRSVRQVFVSGEALPFELKERFLSRLPGVALHNLYGPTEASVDVTFHACESGGERRIVPIGRPIGNTSILLLDPEGQPVPIGVPGELHIGGVNLARGYLGRPELTAEKFIPDGFGGQPGARLYRTGDLARFRPDGEVEFLGRLDHQVKVHGVRIELGEIEAALGRHPAIRETVVLARRDEGDVRLVAYLVPGGESGVAPEGTDLRAFLREHLPEAMIPSVFVSLPAFPLNPSGKVDRKALPAPRWSERQAAYVAPRTPVEELLAAVWSELLGVERVGVGDSFFELGGNSLLATQVASRVRSTFGVEMPLRTVFERPMLAELAGVIAELLRQEPGPAAPPLLAVPRTGPLPLSFAQQRLWFLERLEPGSSAYNIPNALRVNGALRPEVWDGVLSEIVRRHESLRTTFGWRDGEPVQVIGPAEPVTSAVHDLSSLAPAAREAEARRLAVEEARRPFDLEGGPLLRSRLLRLTGGEWLLLVTVHHIASDGWSTGVLIRELQALYGALLDGRPSPLAELAVQYADFAVWQREWLQGEVLERQLAWWREHLAGAAAVLELPADRPRPAVRSTRGGRVPVRDSAGGGAGAGGLGPCPGGHPVHALPGGVPGVAGPPGGPRGPGGGDADRGPRAGGARASDRPVPQHAGTTGRPVGRPDVQPASGTGARGGSGGLRASGAALRASGGRAGAGAQPDPRAGVPGAVRLPERSAWGRWSCRV